MTAYYSIFFTYITSHSTELLISFITRVTILKFTNISQTNILTMGMGTAGMKTNFDGNGWHVDLTVAGMVINVSTSATRSEYDMQMVHLLLIHN